MKTIDPYELLIRQNADGSLKGAHKQNIERVTVDGEVLSERELPPEPIEEADLADFLGDASGLIAQIETLSAELAATKAERNAVEGELASEQAAHAETKTQLLAVTGLAPITRDRFIGGLVKTGLFHAVNSYFAQLADDAELANGSTGSEAKLRWATALYFSPVEPLLLAIAKGKPFNLTDDDIAAMFSDA